MSKLIIANWKMNPATVEEAVQLARATDHEQLVICPPFVFLEELSRVIDKGQLGAQDLFWEGDTGAFTGEISPEELKNLDVTHVIIGHSERRKNLGETNEMVAKKIATAIEAGLIPILCVGETLEQKEAGQREEVIEGEVVSALADIESDQTIYIAYEPIWAISTNPDAEPDKPENTLEVIDFIKKIVQEVNPSIVLRLKFLYGGSVNSKNASEFLQHNLIEGALIGGASLQAEELNKILNEVS
jgi:triosephosphate isomerase